MFIFLFFSLIPFCYAVNPDLRFYLAADEWTMYPQLQFETYHQIPLPDNLFFYKTPDFKGSPAFKLLSNGILELPSEEACILTIAKAEKMVTRWLHCEPFMCKEMTSKKPIRKMISDPSKLTWVELDDRGKACSFRPYLLIADMPRTQGRRFLITDSKQWSGKKGEHLNVDGYFPDIRFCFNDKYVKCSFNQKRAEFLTRFDGLTPNKKYMELSFYLKIEKCLKPKTDLKCLNSYTLDEKPLNEQLSSYFTNYQTHAKKIDWTPKKIEELKECLKPGSQLTEDTYKGILMKCQRSNDKIAVIDYPEAFVEEDLIDGQESYDFEVPSK